MPIGTPVQVGFNSQAAGASTIVVTTTVASPASSLLLALTGHGTENTTTINSQADSASNSYTVATSLSTTGSVARPFYSVNSAPLPSGGTATTTYGGSAVTQYAGLISISGVAFSGALDIEGAGNTSGGGTAPSVSLTTTRPNDIVIGWVFVQQGGTDSFTEASGWTTGGTIYTSAATSCIRWAYKIVSSVGTYTYNPTLGTSRPFIANVIAFSAEAHLLTLMQVGT